LQYDPGESAGVKPEKVRGGGNAKKQSGQRSRCKLQQQKKLCGTQDSDRHVPTAQDVEEGGQPGWSVVGKL